jgi:4-hydroxybenzoyl-CoA thioesterase
MPFTCRLPVRFGDIDLAKVMYYPRYFHACHVAMEELFRKAVGIPYEDLMLVQHLGYPTVKAECEYLLPVHMGEVLVITVEPEQVGTRSVTWRYEGRRASDGRLAFRARNTCVAIDMRRWTSRPVPPAHRRAFERLMRPATRRAARPQAARPAALRKRPARRASGRSRR